MKTLLDLYKSHTGKVSDKWALYLREYDRLFAPYREQPIALLEIGIQNGGSLEIWSQHFTNAQKFVGCDINPDCAKLAYADPRISVIVGDATTPETQAQVLAQSASFDLIIEDGSHTSSDIVKAFARYFPALKTGGLFVAEDLHCSYWQDYEGGIFHPYSSITFFKHLADMVNHEHWGVEKSRTELIAGFKKVLNVDFDEMVLAEISSIEFLNSICVVRKKENADNVLGLRVVAGANAEVMPVILSLANSNSAPIPQVENQWSSLIRPPAESYQDQIHDIKTGKELLNQKLAVVEQLRNEVEAKQAEVEQLRSDVQARHVEVAYLNHLVAAMQSSRSWRYTSVLRKAGSLARPVVRLLRRVRSSARLNGGYVGLAFKAFALLGQEGWQGIRLRLSGVQSSAPVVTPEGQAVDRNDYQTWIKMYDTLDAQAIERIQAEIDSFEKCPKISVVMPVYNAPLEFLKQAIESVQAQLYSNWELCIADDASTDKQIRPLLESYAQKDSRIKLKFRSANGHISAASNSALELATGEFVALLDNDDLLPINALYRVAKAIIENPSVELIYSDEDKIDADGRRLGPYFKTNWNPDLFYSHNMFSHLGVYKRTLLNDIGGFQLGMEGSQDYDLALRCIEKIRVDQIMHLPYVLYHWRVHPASTAMSSEAKPYAMIAGERAINAHFNRIGVKGRVSLNGYGYSPKYELPHAQPLVSIIIPTRNNHKLVVQCINSIKKLSTYKSYEIILIDNSSDEPESIREWQRIEKEDVCVLRDNGDFNYSRINNQAVAVANGEVIVLLNNDTEVITPNWLEILVSHAMRSDVGPVGAKLLYPDRTIQHAGVVLGLGGPAGHAHHRFPENDHGYFSRLQLTSNFAAVTAACLAVRRDLYLQVGGLDEINLRVAFNDVDFCLKLGERGYRCVYAPDAVLYHHESASRGAEDNPEKLARFKQETDWMRSRWGSLIDNDPYYSPNLTLDHADFSLAWPPRAR